MTAKQYQKMKTNKNNNKNKTENKPVTQTF